MRVTSLIHKSTAFCVIFDFGNFSNFSNHYKMLLSPPNRWPRREPAGAVPPDAEHRRVPDVDGRHGSADGGDGGGGALLRAAAVQATEPAARRAQGRVHHLAQEGTPDTSFLGPNPHWTQGDASIKLINMIAYKFACSHPVWIGRFPRKRAQKNPQIFCINSRGVCPMACHFPTPPFSCSPQSPFAHVRVKERSLKSPW